MNYFLVSLDPIYSLYFMFENRDNAKHDLQEKGNNEDDIAVSCF